MPANLGVSHDQAVFVADRTLAEELQAAIAGITELTGDI